VRWLRCAVAEALLAIALSCQRRLDALFLAGLQIECVPLDLFNNVLLEDLALKTAQRAVQAFAFVELNFGCSRSTSNLRDRAFRVTACRTVILIIQIDIAGVLFPDGNVWHCDSFLCTRGLVTKCWMPPRPFASQPHQQYAAMKRYATL
jgi:hypothetical protein